MRRAQLRCRSLRLAAALLATGGAARALSAQTPDSADAARAQVSVHGRVTERGTDTPVPLAEVLLEGTGREVTTAADGRFAFDGLAAGSYTLRVRRIGFAARSAVLALAADTTLTVALEPLALPLDELVVTAARREQRLADVAVTTELVSREQIEATGASDLAAVLAEQTGIQFQEGHPSGAGVMLQGLSSERVLVLLDGQPLYGRVAGNFDLARIPTSIVERVEVVKGPQSTLYGSEAMGGVVNIVTRSAAPEAWSAVARATAGSDARLDGGITGSIAHGRLAATADLGRRSVERTPGRREPSGALAERTDGAAKLTWTRDSSLAVEASALVLGERQRWKGGALYDFADNTQVSARLGARWSRGAHRLAPALYVSRFDHLARQSQQPLPIAGTGDRQTQRLAEAELLYSGPLLGHALDAGAEVKQEHITSTDGRIAGGARSLTSVEPFVQYELAGERWSVVPGARVTWNEQWGTTVTPRLALRWRAAPALTLRASAGRGFRAPDFKELYLQFVNDGAGYAVYGNEALRPEHSTNLTGGVEWATARVYGRAQLFWNALRDFIETRPIPSTGELARYTYGNVDRGHTAGGDLEAGVTFGALRLEAGYSYLTTRDDATGEPLLGRPTHSGRATLGWAAARGPRVTLTGLYTGATPLERDDSGAVSLTRGAFARVDVHVAQDLPLGLELTAGADNLFDARPDNPGGAVTRQIYAGLTWTINRMIP